MVEKPDKREHTMIILSVLQLVLPAALAVWAVIFPAKDLLGRLLQLASLAALIAALMISGVWLFPPWWSVLVYGAGLLLALIVLVLEKPQRRLPDGVLGWGRAALLASLTVYAGYVTIAGWTGRQPPDIAPVSLKSPLDDGVYQVVNGGTNLHVSSHVVTLDPAFRGHRDFRGQSYGVDIVKLNAWGAASNGVFPKDPRAWTIYGQPVLAPCNGEVKQSFDGAPDMPVPIPDRSHMAGNFVLLSCGDFEVVLAHLAPGSITVAQGQRVSAGQQLGSVGNTGNTNAPHLHIHAQKPSTTASPLAGDPLPMIIDGRYLVRGDRIIL